MSAEPLRMNSIASPMACVPVAQAATTVLIGPIALSQQADVMAGHIG
jgi:hypothetical protein